MTRLFTLSLYAFFVVLGITNVGTIGAEYTKRTQLPTSQPTSANLNQQIKECSKGNSKESNDTTKKASGRTPTPASSTACTYYYGTNEGVSKSDTPNKTSKTKTKTLEASCPTQQQTTTGSNNEYASQSSKKAVSDKHRVATYLQQLYQKTTPPQELQTSNPWQAIGAVADKGNFYKFNKALARACWNIQSACKDLQKGKNDLSALAAIQKAAELYGPDETPFKRGLVFSALETIGMWEKNHFNGISIATLAKRLCACLSIKHLKFTVAHLKHTVTPNLQFLKKHYQGDEVATNKLNAIQAELEKAEKAAPGLRNSIDYIDKLWNIVDTVTARNMLDNISS